MILKQNKIAVIGYVIYMKHQNIISAIEAGDLRRARKLLDDALAPKGSRAFDDIVGSVQSVLSSRGVQVPGIWKKELTQAAVIGLDTFMESNGARKTSRNRHIIVGFVGKHAVDVASYIPVGMTEKELAVRRKTPLHVRVLQILASEKQTAAALDYQFPGYIENGLLGMLGVDCDVKAVISPTSMREFTAEEVAAIAAGVDVKAQI